MKALVDTDLKKLLNRNVISSIDNFDLLNYVEPASIDVPVGSKAYLVKQKFLPFSQKIDYIVDRIKLEELNLENEVLFLKGQTYLIPCLNVSIPENITVKISPKSSIGRIDVMVRAIVDNVGLYDTILPNSAGALWLEVTPQSFNIKIKKGVCLNQLRFFQDDEEFNVLDLHNELKNSLVLFDSNSKPLKNHFFNKNSLFLGLNVEANSLIGYEAIPTNNVIDLTKVNVLNYKKFFREIRTDNKGKFVLEKDKFYILHTKEKISVPLNYSVEMIPFSHLIGELRAHYAGFFDPGFGSNNGAIGVLEIRPHETLTVYDGQPICQIEFFKNSKIPSISYGENGSNYQNQQGPRLSKYFKYD